MDFHLEPTATALVLIDLQNGILAMPVQPHSAEAVLNNCRLLASAFRSKEARVVYVRVDLANMQSVAADASHGDPNAPPPPPEASQLSPKAGFREGDLLITKHHWGAFGLTGLEQTLKQHGIETIVFGGLVTNFGVESSVRQAVALGFDVIIAEDACSALDPGAHRFAFTQILPLLGRVRSTKALIDGLA